MLASCYWSKDFRHPLPLPLPPPEELEDAGEVRTDGGGGFHSTKLWVRARHIPPGDETKAVMVDRVKETTTLREG